MSEHQYVAFLAVDRPVSPQNLAYMREQSTRAEITEWRFNNEYHYGDFRGDAAEMLRRGYDVHLHYANFGIRKLMFRLPGGLPCDKRTFANFAIDDCIAWERDKRGPGGILTIQPIAEAGYEDVPRLEKLIDRLAPLRELLIAGDLRPLFLAWLACCYEEDAKVPPVPAGLGKLTRPLQALADFYELPAALIRRAARGAPPAPLEADQSVVVQKWISRQDKASLQKVVAQLLSTDPAAAKSAIMTEIRTSQGREPWPTIPSTATFGALREAAEK